jgi:hypothetical protein
MQETLPVIQLEKADGVPTFIPNVDIIMSPSIGKLSAAIAKARPSYDAITKNQTNPFYHKRYSDISELIGATALPLAEQEVTIFQFPGKVVGKDVFVTTIIAHSSGEFIQSTASGPGEQKTKEGNKFDMQTVGIAITYLRRYSLGAMLNLGAIDDDGNGLATNRAEPAKAATLTGLHSGQANKAITAGEASSLTSKIVVQPIQEVKEENPLPTPEQRTQLFDRIKALKLDGRVVKGYILRATGKAFTEVPFKEFEELVQKMEKTAEQGQGAIQELVSKKEEKE